MLLKMKPSQVDKSDNPPVIAEQYILILGHLYLCPFIVHVLLLTHMTCDVTKFMFAIVYLLNLFQHATVELLQPFTDSNNLHQTVLNYFHLYV